MFPRQPNWQNRQACTCSKPSRKPGFHSTGRSAAYFAAAYGKPGLRGLTALSEHFFLHPPEGFSEAPLFHPRENMFFARPDQEQSLRRILAEHPALTRISAEQIHERVPVFKPGYLAGAAWDQRGGDLDVDALLQACLRLFRRRGGQFFGNSPVDAIEQQAGLWRVIAGGESWRAPVLVNAAGAWADTVAGMAGVRPLGIQPLRRTALIIDPPKGLDVRDWPNMIDADENFYFKPEAGKILVSPADETPTGPCDVQPDDLDVAYGVHYFEEATGLDIRHVEHSWAGLRNFAPDRDLVTGFDPEANGFFWLAGQGGSGIGCAPAAARLARWLIQGGELDHGFERCADFAELVNPARFTD